MLMLFDSGAPSLPRDSESCRPNKLIFKALEPELNCLSQLERSHGTGETYRGSVLVEVPLIPWFC